MRTEVVNNGHLHDTINQPSGRQWAADENSHLLENGTSSATYEASCVIESSQPRKIIKTLFALACSLALQSGWHLGRCFSHICNAIKVTISSNYTNFLLILVPLALIARQFQSWSPATVCVLHLVAVIPLATTLAFGIKQIPMSLNDKFGNLLMAISGNLVELVICIVALREGAIEVVQSTVLGSILLNLLLVMGLSFFLGGIFNMRDRGGEGVEQNFASATAQTTRSFMTMSLACLVIPASLYSLLSKANSDDKEHSVLLLSRGTAIILLVLYFFYLLFQLHTHPDLFSTQIPYEEDADDYPAIDIYTATFVVVLATYLIIACANYFVSCAGSVAGRGLSQNLSTMVFIPAVSNAAEHITAIKMAIRNKMDLTMGIAAGSCIQISLFITPLLVILGWVVHDKPMTMRFQTFEIIALVFAVLVAYTAQDGRSNYLQGAMLIGLYSIITLALYVSPSDALDKVTCISNA